MVEKGVAWQQHEWEQPEPQLLDLKNGNRFMSGSNQAEVSIWICYIVFATIMYVMVQEEQHEWEQPS